MSNRIPFEWAGEQLELLSDKAMFWPGKSTLIIADPHFGKPSAFRSAGIPVPTGTTRTDLKRLDDTLELTGARRLVVLGDFFHHHTGQCERTMAALSEWRGIHAALDIMIVMGNHDRNSLPPPQSWNVDYKCHPVKEAPFLFCHEPCESPDAYVLSGHIHPSVTLLDPVGPSLRLPCFLFSRNHALLPAFGGFTGTASIRPQAGDRVFGLADNAVIPIPVPARRSLTRR